MLNIADNQNSPEVPINENFRNVKWAELFARNPETTGIATALTWGFIGGQLPINGVMTTIANGTVTLTASVDNYVGVTMAGVVVNTATTPNPLHIPLYKVPATTTIGAYVDLRSAHNLQKLSYGISTVTITDTATAATLTQAQALCDSIITSVVAFTSQRNLVVPLVRRRWAVTNNATGFGVQVIGASGTGTVIAPGITSIVECDGINVRKIV